MATLQEKVKRYGELNVQAKALEVALKPLNGEIKEEMGEGKLTSVEADGFKASLSTQERTAMNEEKLLRKLQEASLLQYIKIKAIPDTDALEKAVFDGVIDPGFLADCVETKLVQVLTVKAIKAPKK